MNIDKHQTTSVSAKGPATGFVVYLIALSCLSLMAFPVADDYSYGLKLRSTPFWEYFSDFYMSWSGRFMSNLLLPVLGAQSNNLLLYQALPVFLIISFVCAVFYFMTQFFDCGRRKALLLSLAFSAMYFSGYVSMGQGIYWMSGGFTYQIAFNAFAVLLGALAHIAHNRNTPLWFHIPVMACTAVATGCTEITMFTTVTLFCSAAVVAFVHNHPKKKTFFIYSIIVLGLSVIATFAPGNFARADNDTQYNSKIFWFGFVTFRALGGGFEAFKWLVLSPFLIFFITALPFLKTRFSGNLLPSLSKKYNTLLAFAGMWGIFFWDYFVSIWASGKHPYARINNAIYTDVIFLSLIFFTVYIAPAIKAKHFAAITRHHKALCWVLLATVLVMPDSLNIIKNTVNGDYAKYYRTVSAQYTTAKATQNSIITVPSAGTEPRPVFFRRLDHPRKTWILDVFMQYWNLDTVHFTSASSDEVDQ